MSTGKLVLYLILGIIALFVVSAVISAVFAAIAFIWFLVRVLAFLAVVGVLGYVGYKLYSLISGSGSTATTEETATDPTTTSAGRYTGSSATGADRIEELRQQYLNDEISEEEYERRLERALDGGEYDSIDRELQRERI